MHAQPSRGSAGASSCLLPPSISFSGLSSPQDLLQAAATGAGWTGIVGSLGLKLDYSACGETKDNALSALQAHLGRLEERAKEPTVEVKPEEIRPSEDLLKQVEVAKAL